MCPHSDSSLTEFSTSSLDAHKHVQKFVLDPVINGMTEHVFLDAPIRHLEPPIRWSGSTCRRKRFLHSRYVCPYINARDLRTNHMQFRPEDLGDSGRGARPRRTAGMFIPHTPSQSFLTMPTLYGLLAVNDALHSSQVPSIQLHLRH